MLTLLQKRKPHRSIAVRKEKYYYAMLALPLLWYLLFAYIPITGNVIAFRRFNIGSAYWGTGWVGLKYFKMFFHSPDFLRALRNTFTLSLKYLVVSFPMPIIFAIMVSEVKRDQPKRIIQSIAYLPRFLSVMVAVGLIKLMLSPTSGLVNAIIQKLGFPPITFLNEPGYFHAIYIVSGIWQWMGWNAIIYFAAISRIDPQLYECAELEGAGRFAKMLHITIPSIRYAIAILLILAVGRILTVNFEKIILLYNQLTYETADVIQTYVFRMGIGVTSGGRQYSLATAVGLFNGLLSAFLIVAANMLVKRLTHNETSLF